MSGFEIAGLILGAFPILISALKGYGELARKVGLWNSIRQEYQKSKNEINAQHVQFIGNLRRLLLTVGVDDARISRLLADPRGGEWEAEDLARWFQDHLQDSHDVLLETINEMGRAMEELKKEIIVDAENIRQKIEQTKSLELSARLMEVFKRFGATRDYQLYRIQFTLGESTRKRLFDEMKGYNDRLRNLLETNNAVSQAQNARDIARDARDGVLACGLWKRASGLYSVLSEAWKCSCWDRHHALLMLQDRHRLSPEPHFQLMLWSDGPHLSSSPDPKSGFYCSTRVEITDEPETHKNIPVRISPPPNKPALKRAIPLPSPGTPRKPVPASGKEQKQQKQLRVRFKGAQETPQITVALVENLGGLESKNRESAERGHQSGQQITCLCTTLREQHPPPRSCHGYILAANTRERFYVYSTGSATGVPYQTTKPTKPTPITLESIICGANPPLTRLQRLSLAVTVASSFIQLAGTPWLKPRWAKSDIVFLPDSPAMPHTPSLLDRPFVGRSFVNQHGPKQHDTDDGESKATISGSDEITDGFESLGIVLLELCFGKPIEMHPSWPQLPSGSGLLAALEWLKDVAEEAGPEYASAVAWCLIGGRTISTSRGDGWRRVMSNLVVKPLGQCRGHIAPVA